MIWGSFSKLNGIFLYHLYSFIILLIEAASLMLSQRQINVVLDMRGKKMKGRKILIVHNEHSKKPKKWLFLPPWKTEGGQFLKELKIELPYDPAIPLQGIHRDPLPN